MSSMTFGQKTFQQRAPEKGSFPLDHDGECKDSMMKYMKCLRDNKMNNTVCRIDAKEYLDCRMKHNLMKKEDWKTLGYSDMEGKEQSNNS